MRFPALFVLLLAAPAACVPMGRMNAAGPGASPAGAGPENPGEAAPAAAPNEAPESAAAGPTTVSVTIRSSCPKTVKVFYGDKPKFGSGTQSSVDSNSVSSHTFKPGDLFWITDDEENGVASATVQASTHEIEIGSSCTSLDAH